MRPHNYHGYPVCTCSICGYTSPFDYIMAREQRFYNPYTGTFNESISSHVTRVKNIARILENTCDNSEKTKVLWAEFMNLIDNLTLLGQQPLAQ